MTFPARKLRQPDELITCQHINKVKVIVTVKIENIMYMCVPCGDLAKYAITQLSAVTLNTGSKYGSYQT